MEKKIPEKKTTDLIIISSVVWVLLLTILLTQSLNDYDVSDNSDEDNASSDDESDGESNDDESNDGESDEEYQPYYHRSTDDGNEKLAESLVNQIIKESVNSLSKDSIAYRTRSRCRQAANRRSDDGQREKENIVIDKETMLSDNNETENGFCMVDIQKNN